LNCCFTFLGEANGSYAPVGCQ